MQRAAALVVATVIVATLLVIVYALCAGYMRGFEYWRLHTRRRFPKMFMTEAYDTLKTGDLLFFIPFVHGFTNSMLTQDIFSHGAMLIRDGDRLRIAEATQGEEICPGVHSRNGADVVPFLTRVAHYGGVVCVSRLSQPLGAAEERAIVAAARESYPYPSVKQIIAGGLGMGISARHCFQHVAVLLRAGGLCDFTDSGFIGVGPAITGLPGKKLSGGRAYDAPIQIVDNIEIPLGGFAQANPPKELE